MYWNNEGMMTKDYYGWEGFVQKDKKEFIESYEGQVMKEFYFFGDFIPHGFGVEKIDNQIVYEGEWEFGKYNGQGTSTFYGEKYVGVFKNGRKHGQGELTWSDGRKFVGEFKEGLKSGQGTYTSSDGRKFVGKFKMGRIWNGQGVYTSSGGSIYEGEFKNGKYHGQGTLTYSDGGKDVGEFEYGLRRKGTGYNKNGKIVYKFNGFKNLPITSP